MAADTFSSILGILVMGTGNDNNTWGNNWNNNVGAVFEKAVAGTATHAVTGGTLDLSGSPPPAGPSGAIEMVHIFTGVLASTQTFIVPNLSKLYIINNQTTGSFGLLVKTTSGTAVNAPAGKATYITCDGANTMLRHDAHLVGTWVDAAYAGVPSGAFETVGGTKLIADYPDLNAKLGTLYGGNGTTTFGLPDTFTAGRFRRSRTGSVSVGTAQADAIGSHTHSVTDPGHIHSVNDPTHTHSATVIDPGHNHSVTDPGHQHNFNSPLVGGGITYSRSPSTMGGTTGTSVATTSVSVNLATTGVTVSNSANVTGIAINNHTTGISISATGAAETRPLNISTVMAIWY